MSPTADTLFGGTSVMAILRNLSIEESVRLANTAWDLGIELVEVPIQTPDAVRVLEAVLAEGRARGKPVGAGTVVTAEQLEVSHERGVAFTVAPGLDADLVRRSESIGLPHLPGVATATEIQSAVACGCRWLKAFPADVLGARWFRRMSQGPFPDVSFVATGGMDASNGAEYLRAGASMIAVGSALEDPHQLDQLTALSDASRPSP